VTAIRRPATEQLELRLLLDAVYEQYGYDFREYARSSLSRRVWRRVLEEGLETISGLLERVLHDPACFERLVHDLSINVTSMFRDPSFFSAVRAKVVPLLRTYPFIRVWNPGCSTGEETFSLAIALAEEGLGPRTRIYATDVNTTVIEEAKAGLFPLEKMREYTDQYIRAGGKAAFSDYYKVFGEKARFDPALVDNVVFAQHNLVSDAAFNEFHLIVCRNVLIYFDRSLQEKVHALFLHSLSRFGILGLGHKESIRFTEHADAYEELDPNEKLYRRVS
jgi:chemotaxis protein methyltransferase CheR